MNRILSSLSCISLLAVTPSAEARSVDESSTVDLCHFVVSKFTHCAEVEDEHAEKRIGLCRRAVSKSEDCNSALVNLAYCLEERPCSEISYQNEQNPCRVLTESFIEKCEDAVEDDSDALFLKSIED